MLTEVHTNQTEKSPATRTHSHNTVNQQKNGGEKNEINKSKFVLYASGRCNVGTYRYMRRSCNFIFKMNPVMKCLFYVSISNS